jgi:hypothetical protein
MKYFNAKKAIAALFTCLLMLSSGIGVAMGGNNPGSEDDHLESSAIKEKWEIRVPTGAWREYIYTNKTATHFSGEAVRGHSRSYHGLFCSMHEYLDSWELRINREVLHPDDVIETAAYPHTIYRSYSDQTIMEEIFLPDETNELFVRYSGIAKGEH